MLRLRAMPVAAIAALVVCLATAALVAYARITPAHAAGASTPTPSSVRPCQVYTETDNIVAPSGPNPEGQPNPFEDKNHPSPTPDETWEVYYNVRVDASGTDLLCGMQVVLRITPNGGHFWGPVEMYLFYHDPAGGFTAVVDAETEQTVYAASPGHVVLRSNWFSTGHGTYTLGSLNLNYNYVEAVGVFTV